jgi:hypothetical protein
MTTEDTESTERATPETDDQPIIYAMNHNGYQVLCVDLEFARQIERERNEAQMYHDEALAIGQELADISAHCLGWHIDVVENFKSDHTLALSRKITDTLQRWAKLKEAMK